MGLFDTLLGRTKPVRANLDALFSLPSAAITLQVTAGLVPTGRAGVCFKPPAGQPFAEMQAELEQLLSTPDESTTDAAPPGATPSRPGATPTAAPAPAPAAGHTAGPSRGRQVRIPVDHRGGNCGRRPRHPRAHGAFLAPGRGLEHPAAVLGVRLRAGANPGNGIRHRHRSSRGERVECRHHYAAAVPRVPGQAGNVLPLRAHRPTSNATTSSSCGSRACSPRTSPSSLTCRDGSRCGTSPSPEPQPRRVGAA